MMGPGKAPRLRDGLELKDIPKDRFAGSIEDPRRGLRIRLDRVGLHVVRLLDGSREVPDVCAALAELGLHVSPDLVEKTLALLLRHGFLVEEGGGPPEEESPPILIGSHVLKAAPAQVPRQLYFLPEARHGCVSCGRCCHGYTIGPLEKPAVERIRSAQFSGEHGWLEQHPKVLEKAHEGVPYFEVEKRDGACIFLEQGKTCLLHRAHGAGFKPICCQMFPVRFSLLPSGDLLGFLQMECFQYHEARTRGPALGERAEEMRALLAMAPDYRVVPQRVTVGRDRVFHEYADFESRVLDRVAEGCDPLEWLLWAIGRLVAHLARGGKVDGWSWEEEQAPPRNDRLVHALFLLVRTLGARAELVAAQARGDAFSREILRLFSGIAAAYVGEGDPGDREAIDAFREPDLEPEPNVILREALRNEVFSKEWIEGGDLARGYALMLGRNLLIGAGARVVAARRGNEKVTPSATAEAMATVNRALRIVRPKAWLSEKESLLDGILESFLLSCS